MRAAFYCVADERYFLGAVGLVNSLRLVGHREPIYLLDCGLRADQRALLEREVEVVAAPEDAPPTLLKTIAPLAHPAEAMVLIDTDMIATQPLDRSGDRGRKRQGGRFSQSTPSAMSRAGASCSTSPAPRRQPYVSFAALALGGEPGAEILRLLADRQAPDRLRAHLLAAAPDQLTIRCSTPTRTC